MESLDKKMDFYLKTTTKRLKRRSNRGICVQLNKPVYGRNQIFVVFEIRNKYRIDFNLEFLRVSLINGKKVRNAFYQKLLLDPIMKYNFPELKFLYVLPKFTIGDGGKVILELQIKNGDRKVIIKTSKFL